MEFFPSDQFYRFPALIYFLEAHSAHPCSRRTLPSVEGIRVSLANPAAFRLRRSNVSAAENTQNDENQREK